MATDQHTRTDFLCLTISAGEGEPEHGSHGSNYGYVVKVHSDATGASVRFDYHDSIARHDEGIDQLDRENLLYAFRAFTSDADAGSRSFSEFCGDFGYDEDSREAERIHKACKTLAQKFDRLFHDHREPGMVLELLELEGIE